MTDVVLHQDRREVQVECDNLNVQGHDLLLSNSARRRPGGPLFRRALVHDEGDGLTINFAGDYPGGVTISGPVALAAIRPLSRNPSDLPTKPAHLVVHGGITYEVEGVTLEGRPAPSTVSVGDQIEELHRKIAELAAKVAVLEG